MAKKRTRKQKENARHNLSENSFQPVSYTYVKSQIKNDKQIDKAVSSNSKNAEKMAKEMNLSDIKRDLTKSLIFSILILTTVVMIYFAW